jgi:phage/plasmid primase-like uncharacterized protein
MENNIIENIEKIDGRKLRNKNNRSEKQIEAFNKVCEIRALKRLERKAKREEEEALRNKEIENKIVLKALSIKKRQIKENILLDKIKDDETPINEIKNLISKKKIFNFV